jgi:hypothetical protein
MRKYQRIWEVIRNSPNHTASLTATPETHRRIIKAVKKEKSIDLGWKLILQEQGIRYKLQFTIHDSVIIFTLKDSSPISIQHL